MTETFQTILFWWRKTFFNEKFLCLTNWKANEHFIFAIFIYLAWNNKWNAFGKRNLISSSSCVVLEKLFSCITERKFPFFSRKKAERIWEHHLKNCTMFSFNIWCALPGRMWDWKFCNEIWPTEWKSVEKRLWNWEIGLLGASYSHY